MLACSNAGAGVTTMLPPMTSTLELSGTWRYSSSSPRSHMAYGLSGTTIRSIRTSAIVTFGDSSLTISSGHRRDCVSSRHTERHFLDSGNLWGSGETVQAGGELVAVAAGERLGPPDRGAALVEGVPRQQQQR